ncbi:MAG: trypsin-like peptidase domain-containing protein [Proteobacteria bacterium]|nr:trypsin-like peptidase domain-containing protein [Pseudomonadota bacterium]
MLWFALTAALAQPLADPEGEPSGAGLEQTLLITTGASVCSGVYLGEGRVLTAYHCIAGGGRSKVARQDGTFAIGRVTHASVRDDLAILAVDFVGEGAVLASAAPSVGDVVRTIGHPYAAQAPGGFLYGTLRYSLSQGVVAAVGPVAIQTTAPVNPGNSGGPVFDSEGEVVGVVSRRLRGDGLGFATRVERVHELLESGRSASPIGGTFGLNATAAAWSGPAGTLAVGGFAYASFRDRVVLSASAALPLAPRWDSVQFGEIAWVQTEAHFAVRQRVFRGRFTAHLDAYGGVGEVVTMTGDRDTLRRRRSSAVAPLAGARIGFGSIVLDAAWVFAEEPAVRGQMRFTWPGKLWIF